MGSRHLTTTNLSFLEISKRNQLLEIVTHAQRVCRLYKKAMRTTSDHYFERHLIRYEQVLLRQRFEVTRTEKDMRKLAAMLQDGEEECLEKAAYDPFIFRDDEHGIVYNRQPEHRDTMVDHWHPWEKANYIDYFNKREELKKEMAAYWKESLSKKFSGDKTPNTPWPIISAEVANLKSN